MKKLALSLLTAVALLPAATALAADIDVPPPPPPVEELRPATYDWTGFYVGAWAGVACIDGSLTDNGGPDYWEMDGCGGKGGALVGYNYQMDDFVLGVEADWGMSGEIARNDTATADFAFAMDHIATFRGRAGYAWDDTLFFATGGLAWTKGDLYGVNGAAAPDHINASHWGWSFGGGVEHAFTDQFRLKLDYLYTRFEGANYSEACCDVDVDDFDDHEIRIGAIWSF